jgi:[acyl-carrier-protein] S-malonyltransferase
MLTRPAFVFPGQGSQHPGMFRDLTVCGPAARDRIAAAEEATGLDLTRLMSTADAATIADPQLAQLLVFVASGVLLAELRERGVEPAAVAGHSLGEYTALTASGSLDWQTALAVVAFRGRVMAEAARERAGTMGAIVGLDLPQVESLCAEAASDGAVAVVANINSARQNVVSGDVRAVRAVLDAAASAGALRAKPIAVGGAYHSPLMDSARYRLAEVLADVRLAPPAVPLVSSVTGDLVDDVEEHRERLIAQVTSPVRWHPTVERLAALGVTEFVEVGPGRVLAGLGREILRDRHHIGAVEAIRRSPVPQPIGGRA